ncbi:peptidase M14 [Ruminiclostridium herbifermentans]|uniref:Peptidase M14 n=1 Tax=Ruminiclostridium herbifermentans TaxID=2488810 RepID=A0A4U7JA34_9FIRM|nr:M14 family zinc carboxypeptidase [Ruminiclostridium herbifermentans]QNU66833.1 peptidase M14 [Ruminiclostridium herbifermentans]
MVRKINISILLILFILSSFSSFAAETEITYSKTLQQIYNSKNVYTDTQTRLNELNKNYSNITYLFTAGKSVQNRDLTVLKVGKGPKKIFINASHHPREYMGTILTLNQAQYILEAYSNNKIIDGCNIKQLLDNEVSFYFMPLVNPDGVQICVNGSPAYYFNANKVDLNHNCAADWTKRITSTYSTGTSPFSEPETKAVKYLCETVEFDLTIAYHAAGDIIYWYYGQQGAAKTRDLAYANILKDTTGYSLVSTSNYKSSTSGFKDWCVQTLKIPSFTIEIGGKRGITKPIEWSLYNSIWEKNKLVPLRMSKQLLKQTQFNGDKKTALIYKNSLVHLSKDILKQDKKNYISVRDAKILTSNSITETQQYKLKMYSLTINNTYYIDIDYFKNIFNLKYTYDEFTNTIYLE